MFKLIAFVIWWSAISAFIWYKNTHWLTNADLWRQLYSFITWTVWWPVAYIFIYAFRPIILFPASILTLLSWMIFWPIRWIVYTIFGENASANFAYWIGSKLWKWVITPSSQWVFAAVKERITENEFMSMLMLRIIPLPFDLVNYSAWILQVSWKKYALATFLWIMPWLATFVLFGASVENVETFNFSEVSLNWSYLTIALILYVVSISIALLLKKKMKKV